MTGATVDFDRIMVSSALPVVLTGSSAATATGGVEGVTAATLGNATFTDSNAGALLTDFTVTAVTWGDGSTDTTGLTVSGSGGSYMVNGSHLYGEESARHALRLQHHRDEPPAAARPTSPARPRWPMRR